MADPLRRRPSVAGPGLVRPSRVDGGQEALASANALQGIARAASQVSRNFRVLEDERQAERDRSTAAEVRGAISVETDDEGRARLNLPLEQAAAIENDDARWQALSLGSVSAARNHLRERISDLEGEMPLDLEGQREALEQTLTQLVEGVDPVISTAVSADLEGRIGAHLGQVQAQVNRRDVEETRDQVALDMDALMAEASTLIEQYGPGALESEAYQTVQASLETKYLELENPALGFTRADIDRIRRGNDLQQEQGVARHTLDGVVSSEGFEAAYATLDELSAGMQLTAAERAAWERPLRQHLNQSFTRANQARIAADRAEAEEERNRAQAQANLYHTMRVDVARGRVSYDDLEGALESGRISVAQWANLNLSLMSENTNAAADFSLLQSGLPLDQDNSDHRRAVGRVFDQAIEELGGMAGLAENPDTFRQVALGVAQEYNIIPETLESGVRAQIYSGDPDQIAGALDVLSSLNREAPSATRRAFSEEMVGHAAVWEASVAGGMSRAEATAMVVRAQEVSRDPGNEIRRQRANEFAQGVDAGDIEQIFQQDAGGFWGGRAQFRDDLGPEADAAVSLYRRFYSEAYGMGYNEPQAKAFAEAGLRRSYGVTRIYNGRARLMQHPPEAYYPDFGDDGAWMREQLLSDVREAVGEDVRAEQITLVSDRDTAREASQGRLPSYSVVYQDETGALQAMPGRYSFDADDVAAEARRGLDASVSEARNQRAVALEELPLRQLDVLRRLSESASSSNPDLLRNFRDADRLRELDDEMARLEAEIGPERIEAWEARRRQDARAAAGL
jgi:hypothetical protein